MKNLERKWSQSSLYISMKCKAVKQEEQWEVNILDRFIGVCPSGGCALGQA